MEGWTIQQEDFMEAVTTILSAVSILILAVLLYMTARPH